MRHEFSSAQGLNGCKGAYQIKVTITNRACRTVKDVIYRRVMDWDVNPHEVFSGNPDDDLVTLSTGGLQGAGFLDAASNNGFCNPNPSTSCSDRHEAGDPPYTFGPADIGAHFDLNIGELSSGHSKVFNILYGYFPENPAGSGNSDGWARKCTNNGFRTGIFSIGQDANKENAFLFAVSPKVGAGHKTFCDPSIPRNTVLISSAGPRASVGN